MDLTLTQFANECAVHARTMPTKKACAFLHTALQLMGDCDAAVPLRTAYIALQHSDSQLSLLAEQQGRLM